jgi:hypothetical protein
VLATLRQPYPTIHLAGAAANALLGTIAEAIPTQTSAEHNVTELDDEEMEVMPPSSPSIYLLGSSCLTYDNTVCSICELGITLPPEDVLRRPALRSSG